jgi:predicted nucleotidyltransferase
MLEEIISKKDELADLCRAHHVRHLAVFGSALRDDFDPARSDIDFRVEFGSVPEGEAATNYLGLVEALEELFARSVDLLSSPVIENRYLRREIESTQRTLYAA